MQKLKCLLIDDDADDREIFSIALKEVNPFGECSTAINGEDALEILKSRPDFIPDFIFLDLNMPFMNGQICLAELKKLPIIKNVPVIIYTTSSYQKDIDKTKALGAAHFLIKPSSIKSLISSLTALIKGNELPYLIS